MSYYLLIERDTGASPWFVNFGDSDKECVEFEREDVADHGALKRNLKIVKFARVPTQAQIDAKLAELNA